MKNSNAFIRLLAVLVATLDVHGTGLRSVTSIDASKKLRLLVLLPAEGEDTEAAALGYGVPTSIRIALDLAAEQINNRFDLLSGYELELVHGEVGCTIFTDTAVGLTTGLFPGNHLVVSGVIGPVCSMDSSLVSSVITRNEVQLVQIRSSGSPLSPESAATNALDILGTTQTLVDLALALVKNVGWRNIAILYDDVRTFDTYQSAAESFLTRVRELETVDLRYVSTVVSTFYPLDQIWNSKARIVFLFTSVSYAKRIMCLAHHYGIVYPKYQWIIINHRLDDFKRQSMNFTIGTYECSFELLNTTLERSLFINFQLSTTTPDLRTYANLTFDEFLQVYENRVEQYNRENLINSNIASTYWAYNLYDATWAWAIVLNELLSKDDGIVFEYGNTTLASLILNEFYSLTFQGISGNITFDSGHTDRQASLHQILSGEELHVAYGNGTEFVVLKRIDTVPDVVENFNIPHISFAIIFLTIHCLEFVLTLILHVLTIVYRDTKLVKASSPKLTHFAFFGTYTFTLAQMLNTSFHIKLQTPSTGAVLCQAVWAWLVPISFTFAIGIVTLRTWRLYRIFMHFLNPGKSINSPVLITILIAMLSLDVLIGTIWTVADPMRFYFVEYAPDNGPENEIFYDVRCFPNYNLLWLGIVFLYKIILLSVMVILSLLTRRIPNPVFSTTLLRKFAYIFSIVMVVGFAIYFLFLYVNSHSNYHDYTLTTILAIMSLLFIFLILIPPLVPAIKEKLRRRTPHHSDISMSREDATYYEVTDRS